MFFDKSEILCLSPNLIKNPNYGLSAGINRLKDTTSQYIYVPCGHCSQCVSVRQMYLVQRVQMESLDNHLFFCTLTYNDEFLPVKEVNGYNIRYADLKHLQLLFKRVRNGNLFGRPFRHFAVSERGKENGRPHFHVLLVLPKYDSDDFNTCLNLEKRLYDVVLSNWVVNVGSHRVPDYKPLCTFRSKYLFGRWFSNYDLHYLNPSLSKNGVSECAFYVLKYMMKPSIKENRLQQALRLNLDPDEYDVIWQIVKSRWTSSHGFGLGLYHTFQSYHIVKYLRDCIKKTPSDSLFPCYFSPFVGNSFPLSPFYKKIPYIFDSVTELDFFMRNGPIYDWKRVLYNDHAALVHAHEKMVSVIDSNDLSDSIELLYG